MIFFENVNTYAEMLRVTLLQIPPLPPSFLRYCNIIDISYTLQVGWRCIIYQHIIIVSNETIRACVLTGMVQPHMKLQCTSVENATFLLFIFILLSRESVGGAMA